MDLSIVNKPTGTDCNFTRNPALIWQTCLRKVYFFKNEDAQFLKTENPAEEFLSGEKAYQFLLEVLSGMASPLVGETEVLGQFKKFLKDNESSPSIMAAVGTWNSLLRDCKIVRDQHLKNLGCHSYGSLCRKLLKGKKSVSMIGAGQLVQEILPWFKEFGRIEVLCRNQDKAKTMLAGMRAAVKDLQVLPLNSLMTNGAESVVVCAPMSNAELISYLGGSRVEVLVDLRGGTSLNGEMFNKVGKYLDLNAVMASIDKDRQAMLGKLAAAKETIQRLSNEYACKVTFRPNGWDDLCA